MATHRLGFMQLAIMVGYSVFYAWYLLTFFEFFISFPEEYDFTMRHLGQAVLFAGSLVATELILLRFRKRGSIDLMHGRAFYVASPLLGMALPACVFANALGIQLVPALFYLACLSSGLYVAIGFVYWDDVVRRGYIKHSIYAHGMVFAAGGGLFVICELCLSLYATSIISIAFLLVSAYLLVFIGARAQDAPKSAVEETRAFFKKVLHLDVATCLATIPFGFAFVLLYLDIGFSIVLVIAGAVVFDLVFSMLVGRTHVIPFVGSLRICVLLVVLALLLFAVSSGLVRDIALGTIVIVWFIYRTVHGGSLMEMAMSNRLSLQYTVSRGKLASNIGFCLGLVVGIAALALAGNDSVVAYVAIGLTALVVTGALILLPFDNETNMPGIMTLKPIKYAEVPSEGQHTSASLDEKCQRIIELYKLSPREGDVLVYIVQGRNAKHVAEKLFISENTAKTHIANIYKKMNVHSVQELLDALEYM